MPIPARKFLWAGTGSFFIKIILLTKKDSFKTEQFEKTSTSIVDCMFV